MSEVKRWEPRNTAFGYDMQPLSDGSFVLFDDFDRVTTERDAALGREAELLEELSTAQRGLANCKLALDAQTHNYGVTNLRLIGAEQRLTAADERADRNATLAVSLAADKHALGNRVNVLEGLLRETSAILRIGDGYGWEDRAADRIDAALKPTEGVGAKSKHYECIGKGGDYTVVAIAQGAGTLKGFNHYVYKNADGIHFVRDPEDFLSRMQIKP